MIAGSQNFPCSWGHNFVCSVMGTILMNINQMLVYKFVEM